MRKKLLLVFSFVIVALVAVAVMGSSFGSSSKLKDVRPLSTNDDTASVETATMFEDHLTSMVMIRNISQPLGAVAIEFYGQGAENSTGQYCVSFSKGPGCPVEYACHGTFTLGKSTNAAGDRYADLVEIVLSSWIRTPWKADGYHYDITSGSVDGAGIGKLIIDSCEYDYIQVKIKKTTCSAAGAKIHNFN